MTVGSSFNLSFQAGHRPVTIGAANQLPNLNLWYNGSASNTVVNGVQTANFSTAVSNGTLISSWIDLANTAGPSNVNGGNANRPTYITPIQNSLGSVFYKSANNNNLDINPTAWAQNLSGMTVYVVARPTNFPATKFPLTASGGTNFGMWWNGTDWNVGQSAGNYANVTVTNDTTKFHTYGMIFNGAATGNANRLQFRYDKAATTLSYTGTIGANTGSINYFFFGGNNRNVGDTQNTFMDGYIGEVLIWTRALNSSEILAAETYIANKWGI